MKKFKVLIIDDEALARLNIRQALEPFEKWQVIAELNSGKQLFDVINKTQVHVVFLDIQMPGENGIELAKKIISLDKAPQVVFVTAYDEYAINAFELSAIDYLLKPFDDDRFFKTLKKLEQQIAWSNINNGIHHWQKQNLNPQHKLDKLLIRSIGSIKFIDIDDVYCFISSGNYVEVHHIQGMHLHRVSLSFLETKLDHNKFCRIHRSSIVKISEVKELKTLDDGSHQLFLTKGLKLKISSAYKTKVFDKLGLSSSN